jgi:hypothetical protein
LEADEIGNKCAAMILLVGGIDPDKVELNSDELKGFELLERDGEL